MAPIRIEEVPRLLPHAISLPLCNCPDLRKSALQFPGALQLIALTSASPLCTPYDSSQLEFPNKTTDQLFISPAEFLRPDPTLLPQDRTMKSRSVSSKESEEATPPGLETEIAEGGNGIKTPNFPVSVYWDMKGYLGWIEEMASHVKSIDGSHPLEVGLEGFYGESKKGNNPGFSVGTNFITNNQITGIDFATVHSYPDIWLAGSSEDAQISFLHDWISTHLDDANKILKKPVLFAEFGKSSKDPGFDEGQRDNVFRVVY